MQLTDKERNDRARVVLPFEHQGTHHTVAECRIYKQNLVLLTKISFCFPGNGKESLIYNGRLDVKIPSTSENIGSTSTEKAEMGEINYLRDSDDERPDSDEDPDDDLDI